MSRAASNRPPEDIARAIAETVIWERIRPAPGTSDCFYRSSKKNLGVGSGPDIADYYSLDDFISIDPRLGVVLSTEMPQSNTAIPGILVRDNLTYWLGNYLSVWGTAYGVPRPERHLYPIHQLYAFELTGSRGSDPGVVLDAMAFYPQTTPCGTHYTRPLQSVEAVVSIAEFTEQFPGWEERYQLAKTLDLDAATAANYIVAPQSIAPHLLTGTTVITLPDTLGLLP